jgi:hypothetical protein
MSELTQERKAELKAESNMKLDFMQREYWRCRNGKQRYIRCPFCSPLKQQLKRRNFIGAPQFCCDLFAKALKAILDRQDEVDKAANATRRACHLMNEAQNIDRAHAN